MYAYNMDIYTYIDSENINVYDIYLHVIFVCE